MRILIMSDSHGQDRNVKKAIKREGPLDGLIHLGDLQGSEDYIAGLAKCPTYFVCGNCDYYSEFPDLRVEEFGDCRIMMTHGHHFYVSYGIEELVEEARERDCQAVLFGHTHRPLLDYSREDIIVVNPGSISYPRQEGRQCSYVVLELRKGFVPDFALKYL